MLPKLTSLKKLIVLDVDAKKSETADTPYISIQIVAKVQLKYYHDNLVRHSRGHSLFVCSVLVEQSKRLHNN